MLNQGIILHTSRIIVDFLGPHEGVITFLGFGNYINLVIVDFHALDLSRIHLFQEFIIGDFLIGYPAEHFHKKAHAYQRYQCCNQQQQQVLLLRWLSASSRPSLPVPRAAALAVVKAIAAVIII